MRLRAGEVWLEVTDDQAADLRRQLGSISGDSPQLGTGMIDAAEVARRLGLSREFVYSHAEQLGGQKIGSRWRFDPAKLEASSDLWVNHPQVQFGAPPQAVRAERQAPKPRRRKAGLGKDLLEIRGDAPYAGWTNSGPRQRVNADRGPDHGGMRSNG